MWVNKALRGGGVCGGKTGGVPAGTKGSFYKRGEAARY